VIECVLYKNFSERSKENRENFNDYARYSRLDMNVRPLEQKVTAVGMALACILPFPASHALSLLFSEVLCFILVYELPAFDGRCATVVLSHIGMVYRSITSNVNSSAYSNGAGMEIDYLFPWWIRG
jgi:hypothetical protein